MLKAVLFCCLMALCQGAITTSPSVIIPVPSSTDSSQLQLKNQAKEELSKDTAVTASDKITDLDVDLTKKTTTTTTSSTTTSTTTSPTTTTPPPTPAPTPAPAPSPLPPPQPGNWSYPQDNVTCILVQFAAQLNVTYTKAVNDSTALDYVILNVPANATVSDGNCNGTEQWLRITWPSKNNYNSLVLVFSKNDTTHDYSLKNLNVSLAADVFPNASFSSPLELWHGAEWEVPLARSYSCAEPTRLNMTAESNGAASLTLTHLQEEAFRVAGSKGFSAARECGGGDLPDAVPIAVGCALGGLVLIVLVAYLLARRRSAARGYLSM